MPRPIGLNDLIADACDECGGQAAALNDVLVMGKRMHLCAACVERLGDSCVISPPEVAPTAAAAPEKAERHFEFTGLLPGLALSVIGVLALGGGLILLSSEPSVADLSVALISIVSGCVLLGFAAVIQLLRLIAMRLNILLQRMDAGRHE